MKWPRWMTDDDKGMIMFVALLMAILAIFCIWEYRYEKGRNIGLSQGMAHYDIHIKREMDDINERIECLETGTPTNKQSQKNHTHKLGWITIK